MGAAVRHRHRLAAGARQILGQDRIGWSGALTAGATTGRDRLPVADLVRPQGPDRRVPLRSLWRGFRVPLDRRGACVRRDGFPLLVRPIRLALEAIDRRLEDAAATLGANPALVFFTVTLPLALPGIIAGAVLCFARALGEFGATITFVSNIPGETQTISAAIYTFLQIPDGDAAAGRLVVVAIVLSLVALIAAEWLGRRASTRFHGE